MAGSKSRLSSHDAFFASIVGMIPKELYKPSEENDVELNSKYYKVCVWRCLVLKTQRLQ